MSEIDKKSVKTSIEQILGEKFVHSLSKLIYNDVSSIWHIDKESEKLISSIAAQVAAGIFCLNYLSHVNELIKEKLGVEGPTDKDLTDEKKISELKGALAGEQELTELAKRSLVLLKRLVASIEGNSLEEVTKLAHTGDYLLSILEEMRESGHQDYQLWLRSIPHYYEKDLLHLSLINSNDAPPSGAEAAAKQIPIEALGIKRPPSK